ncbi:MAG: hypothetical protein R3F37_07025 [Candidatus Competibacteraceae bacterium]
MQPARANEAFASPVSEMSSPPDFMLDGCDFLSLEVQRRLPYRYSDVAPERHYARKNIGYLEAMASGARYILETDDDNFPAAGFWDMPPANTLVDVRRGQAGSMSMNGSVPTLGRGVFRWIVC